MIVFYFISVLFCVAVSTRMVESMENVCNSEINQLMKACKCVDCNGSFHQGCVPLVTGYKVNAITVSTSFSSKTGGDSETEQS